MKTFSDLKLHGENRIRYVYAVLLFVIYEILACFYEISNSSNIVLNGLVDFDALNWQITIRFFDVAQTWQKSGGYFF